MGDCDPKQGKCEVCKEENVLIQLRWAPDFGEEWRPVWQCAECDKYWLEKDDSSNEVQSL